MHNPVLVTLLALLAGTSPSLVRAAEFPPQGGSSPPMSTSPSGFVGVQGPGGDDPERFQALPPPAPAKVASCPGCPALGQAREQQQPQPAQH